MRYLVDIHEKPSSRIKVKTHCLLWDDVVENAKVVCQLGREGKLRCFEYMQQNRTNPFRRSWTGRQGMRNWDDVEKAITEPWKEGMDRLQEFLRDLEGTELPEPRSRRRRPVWASEGGELELDRYLAGQDAWRTTARRDLTGQQFVTILVQIDASAAVTPEMCAWRGIAAVLAAKIVEDHGYGAEIITYDYTESIFTNAPGEPLLQSVWIKRADQPLDLDAAVNGVSCHYFRTINFGSYYCVPGLTPDDGLGYFRHPPEHVLRLLTPDPKFWRIENVWSRESAISAVRALIESLNYQNEDEEAPCLV